MISRRTWLFLSALAPLGRAQFTSGVRVVNVFVTVRDRKNEHVAGLKQDDFELFEDGRKQTIRYFSAESDLPLTLGLLFDLSGSQRTILDQQRAAARTFLKQVMRDGVDTGFVIGFDKQVRLAGPRTGSRARLESALDRLEVRSEDSRGTSLFDAVQRASTEMLSQPGRKAIVVLSDGIDTSSLAHLQDAIEAAHRSDTLVFPIRFYDQEVFKFEVSGGAADLLRNGKKILDRMARETGGALYEVAGTATLEQSFSRIEDDLRHQYSLGFTPQDGRAAYRKLRVAVRPRDSSVHAREGYYFDPQQ